MAALLLGPACEIIPERKAPEEKPILIMGACVSVRNQTPYTWHYELVGDGGRSGTLNAHQDVSRKEPTAPGKGRREREIEQLINARRQLRQNWRKATPQEKEGLKVLWDEVRKNLARLRRVERIRRRRKRREKERTNFFRDPFKYARQLVDEKRSGKLNISKEELEQHIKSQFSDTLTQAAKKPEFLASQDALSTLL
ncbi:hypothetical protein UPYG_G00285280 [Umbra pygmaea]|uniref:Uncharacterized protein n=1 Tax=Umbra pygmaea TaxID=75934 RepID=A0ABD0W3W3_UMBPY